LFVGALASLAIVLGLGYLARRSLIEANNSVAHTDEVRLTLSECRLSLARADLRALGEAEAKVARLTIDNPRQQESLARALALTRDGSRDELDALFRSMAHEENRLMAERLQHDAWARGLSFVGFLAAGVLILVLGTFALAFLHAQLDRQHAAEDELHRSEERFHRLVDAVTDYAIFMLDADGYVASWNCGAEKTKGYVAYEIIGAHFSVFYTPEDRAAGKPDDALATVRREGRFEDESYRVRKDGSRFWANVVITALRDARGEITGFAKVTRDLTARRAAEENARRLVHEQIARAASEIERHEMARASRVKDEFLATMSHELRTPLNAISGWASILRKKPRDEDRLDRGLEVIARNVKAQARLVNDLLDISRIISGKLELRLKRTEVTPIVLAAADVVRPAADGKGVGLVVEVDPHLGETVADPERLQQIVWNLLTNAVRFTPRGGCVTVACAREESDVVVRVRDTGAGISGENLPYVFERFMQVDSTITRSHGGLGLGLAIVRHLVEGHGGRVAAESEGLGRGATFTVTLPIRAVSPREVAARARDEIELDADPEVVGPETSLDGVRVLVVDDDADSIEVLRMVLENAGAQVTAATSARRAFDALDGRSAFDLIISDIGMPEIDGYSLMRRIRSRPGGTNVPAIALTAYARAEDAELASIAGYQVHLPKPVDERQLLESVKEWSKPRTGDVAAYPAS
jgi:PAS domain S-box-containing protein